VVLFATAAVAFAGFVPYELRRGVVRRAGAIVGFSFGQVTGATFDIDGGRQLVA